MQWNWKSNTHLCLTLRIPLTYRIQVGDLVQLHGRTAAMVVQVVQMVSGQHVASCCCASCCCRCWCRCCCCSVAVCCWCCWRIQSKLALGSQISAIFCSWSCGKPSKQPLSSQIGNGYGNMALSFACFQSHHLVRWPSANAAQITWSYWVGFRLNCIYAKCGVGTPFRHCRKNGRRENRMWHRRFPARHFTIVATIDSIEDFSLHSVLFSPSHPPPFFFGATPSIFICGTAFLLAAKTTNAPDATVGNQLLLALSALTLHLVLSGWIGYYVATSLHPLGLWPPHPSTRSNKQAGNKRSSLSREIKLNSILGAAAMCKTTDGRSTKWVD